MVMLHAKWVAASHPRGHVHVLCIGTPTAAGKTQWLPAVLEPSKAGNLIPNVVANALGHVGGRKIALRCQASELDMVAKVTTSFELTFHRTDHLDNYRIKGNSTTPILLGRPFVQLFKNVWHRQADYLLEIDPSVMACCTHARGLNGTFSYSMQSNFV